uniref:Acetyl-coenzyme A synthetase n=1 Tax=Tetraselmis chuii TaxID=63592 RepID=A0A7S1SKL6_9CHLO|mmetsp:Transcript_1627/g.2854  ORF Transcript_1627/g.2854 Transcript_1627/m.2854 type:complete len:662 (+) Transcript_1627:221-2206(+)
MANGLLKNEYGFIEEFAANARVRDRAQYDEMYRRSLDDPEGFWGELAGELYWSKTWEPPFMRYNFKPPGVNIEWFIGAETNVCYNALDRHIEEGRGDKAALIWEGNEPGVDATFTFEELRKQVCRTANLLKSLGVGKGDDVTIYMPMIPAMPIAMLACARIGAVHSIVFAGFSDVNLASRMVDSKPKVIMTAAAGMRGPKVIKLKGIVDSALESAAKQGHRVEHCLVADLGPKLPRDCVAMSEGRDRWLEDELAVQSEDCPVEWMDSEAPLFKLYTSGSTGKPKGVVHTTGGYMVGTYATVKYVFDIKDDDVLWCTADCGWVTGHSYLVYGPLLNGTTTLCFEGVPTYPDAGRLWQVVDKYAVTVFYTAPTVIRSLMAMDDSWVTRHSRASLRLLGSVGEPINPEAWRWYFETVGDSRCPIADTWWQTETGAHMITGIGAACPMRPGAAGLPFFGVEPVVVDEKGNVMEGECSGVLAVRRPWPSILRTVAGNHARFEEVYFTLYHGLYFTGDGCKRDKDGYIWITGRVDDVINVSGHRIGTAEVESALVGHPAVAEAAVVPATHGIKGQALYAFVTLKDTYSYPGPSGLKKELCLEVRRVVGAIAVPDFIHWAPALPKTRSGKIMRRILRKIADKKEDDLGDITTLADPTAVNLLLDMRGM